MVFMSDISYFLQQLIKTTLLLLPFLSLSCVHTWQLCVPVAVVLSVVIATKQESAGQWLHKYDWAFRVGHVCVCMRTCVCVCVRVCVLSDVNKAGLEQVVISV